MAQTDAHESSVATYVIVALVLGVITYIEFAIVEYEIAWLSNFWILFWLVLLSVAKFILVVMFFMHLKDDDNLYTGFFSSGMVFALGTFVVLALLFTLPATFRFFQAETAAADPHGVEGTEVAGHGDDHGLSEDVLALIGSDGYSETLATRLNTPRPKNLTVTLTPPALPEESAYSLTAAPALFAPASATEGAATEEDAEAVETAQTDATTEEAAADDAGADDAAAETESAAAWDEELGAQVYASNCSSCHQANGAGIPGAFPPLAGHMPELYNADGGREYLMNVLLYGLQGQIEVGGQSYSGVMPAWQQLSDEQIAAVLNHELTSWENEALLEDFAPIAAEEVAGQRGAGLSMGDVLEERQALSLP